MIAKTLVDCLEFGAARFPLRTAIIEPDGSVVTYAELNRNASALAARLLRAGVGRGHRVGIMLPKSAEAITAIYGAMKTGAAYVPMDPAAPPERSRQILNDAQLDACFVEPRNLPLVLNPASAMKPKIIIVIGADADASHLPVVTYQSASECDADSFASGAQTADLAYIMYTSGSTGIPKGVMISHENAVAFVNWYSSLVEPTPDDRFGTPAPLFFDGSVLDIFPPLLHGASIGLIPDNAALHPRELAAYISGQRLTILFASPSALAFLAQFGELQNHDAANLRVVLFGGEIFPIKHLREIQRHWPKPIYYNVYGPTETTVLATAFRIPQPIPEDRQQPYPIGFAAPHCQTRVFDEQGRDVPPGGEGLLHISGPSVSAGYWNRPEQDATAFNMRDGQRWYNTGDWVRWDDRDGFTYLGRKDRMVKRRSYRIELDEIEKAFYQHQRVREAAVVSKTDAEGGVKIFAFLTLEAGDPISLVDWKIFCSSKLPKPMSPDQFFIRDHLPRTATEKVDYQALVRSIAQ